MLPMHAKEAVEELTNIDTQLLLRWYPKVEAAFMVPLSGTPISHFFSHIDPTVEYGVEVCAELLSRKLPEKIVSDENLKALQKDFAELRAEVIADDNIPPPLKKLILHHVNEILKAISDYDITGIQPLEHAVENAVGSVLLHPEIHQKTEVGQSFGRKLKMAASILLLLQGLLQLPNEVNSVRKLFFEMHDEPAIEVDHRSEGVIEVSAEDSVQESKGRPAP